MGGAQDPAELVFFPLHAGIFQGPDLCCREHDRCPQTISPFQYNYGIRNFRFHTISHCDCDTRLAEGLRLRDRAELLLGFQRILKISQHDLIVLMEKQT